MASAQNGREVRSGSGSSGRRAGDCPGRRSWGRMDRGRWLGPRRRSGLREGCVPEPGCVWKVSWGPRVSWLCIAFDIKRRDPHLGVVGYLVLWSLQGWGWGAAVSREGERRVKGRDGWRRRARLHSRERGVASPAQLFVCVHTAPTCVWGGDCTPLRGGMRVGPDPWRSGRSAPWRPELGS